MEDLGRCLAREAPLAVVDLEMTGLDPEHDRVIEVAVVRGRAGRVQEEFEVLLDVDVPMSRRAVEVHGITPEMLQGAPRFGEVVEDVERALAGAVLVAHHVPLDSAFLDREMSRVGRVLGERVWVDTLTMARRLFAFRRNDLKSVCQVFGIPLDGAHRALSDARATFSAYHAMLCHGGMDPGLTVGGLRDNLEAMASDSELRRRQWTLLEEALASKRTVVIAYQSSSLPRGGVIEREVEVRRLRFPKVRGWCRLRGDERVFRLDRIRSVRLGDDRYELPSPGPRTE